MKDVLAVLMVLAFGVLVFVLIMAASVVGTSNPARNAQLRDFDSLSTQIYEMRQDIHSLQTQVAKQDSR